MPPYLTSLQIFENYKKANPQKCKGKSTTEICRLAGLNDKQIAELKTTSAWLFCFDKETANTSQDFSMTEILGGHFTRAKSKQTKKTTKNTKIIPILKQSDIDCLARKSDYTTNLEDLQNYVSNNVDGNNIIDFLTKYEKAAGKSIIKKLCDCKLASNTQRKNIALNIVSKIEQCSKNKNKNFSNLITLLKDEINYQFDKSGFIETSYIQAPFQALVKMVQRKPLEFNEQKAGDFEREFSSKNLKYSSKKEKKYMLGKRNIGKSITYDLGKGKSFVEYYLYDYSKQAYRISDKQFMENGKVTKTAIYDEFENLSQVHEYIDNKHIAYFFKNNNIGTSTISDNSSYQEISHRKGEVCERHTYVDGKDIREQHFNDDNEERSYYPLNYRISYFKDNKTNSEADIINTYFEIESDNISCGFLHELKQQLNTITEPRYGKKVLDYAKSILVKRAQKLNVDISDLIDKYLTLKNDNKEDILKGISLLSRIRGRCAIKENPKEVFIPKSKPLNGKVDGSAAQGAMGDCWLLAGINSLRRSNVFSKILKYDNEKKEIIVTLPGAPKGKQVYRYSQEDVDKCTEFSNGDGDVRAIEMAISDMLYATGMNKYNIEGGFEKEAIYYLTAKKENFQWKYTKNPENLNNLKSKLKNEATHEYSVGGCGFRKKIEQYGIIPNHAYSITKIDNNFVYIMNPYGEKKGDKMELVEKKVPINIFIESCMSLSLFDV